MEDTVCYVTRIKVPYFYGHAWNNILRVFQEIFFAFDLHYQLIVAICCLFYSSKTIRMTYFRNSWKKMLITKFYINITVDNCKHALSMLEGLETRTIRRITHK